MSTITVKDGTQISYSESGGLPIAVFDDLRSSSPIARSLTRTSLFPSMVVTAPAAKFPFAL
jgi:hypothetical protein